MSQDFEEDELKLALNDEYFDKESNQEEDLCNIM